LSKKPTVQRLRLSVAKGNPFGRRRLVNAHLSASLRSRLGIRSMPVREGDTVRVVKGEYAGKRGRIRRVLRNRGRVEIVGITEKSGKGDTIYPKISISYLEITRLNMGDKWRRKIISRKTGKEITAEVEREIAAPEKEEGEAQEEAELPASSQAQAVTQPKSQPKSGDQGEAKEERSGEAGSSREVKEEGEGEREGETEEKTGSDSNGQ